MPAMAQVMTRTPSTRIGSRDQQALLMLVAATQQQLRSGRVLTADDVRRAFTDGRRHLPGRARGYVGKVADRYENAVVRAVLANPAGTSGTIARQATEYWMSERRW
jgi:hypothetical protein